MKLWLEQRHLDLKVNWKLSRNQTTFKENFIVHLETPSGTFRSEIAPNIRYEESPEKIQQQFAHWLSKTDLAAVKDPASLLNAISSEKLYHSLSFGIESAFIGYLASKNNQSITQYLDLPPIRPLETSFSMPITAVGEIEEYLRPLKRFHSLKIKVDANCGLEMLQEIVKHTSVKLRVDANEGWKDLDQFMRFQENLDGMNIELIEQPFPSSMVEEYKILRKNTPYVLLADESIEDVGNFSDLALQFHAVNIKLMKTGSLIKARDLLLKARAHHLKSMIGCMIETSVGISYGMLFGGMVDYVDLDGFLLVKDEPFNLVSEAEGILKLN